MPQDEHVASPATWTERRPPRGLDAFLVLVTAGVNIGGVLAISAHAGTAAQVDAWGLALLVTGPLLLWWRRRHPVLVLAGCAAATWLYLLTGHPMGPVFAPTVVALVSAITNGARLVAYLGVLGTVVLRLGAFAVPGIDAPSLASTMALAAWLAFLVALGEVLRHRRALLEARHHRLRMAMAAEADQVRRESVEERLQLARDLHDVLGHKLAVINIQAKAGLQVHSSGRPGVTDALHAVEEASSQALEDVQAFLDSLRERDHSLDRNPSPSLSDLESLVASARTTGLDVRIEVTGTPRRLPAPHDLAASRVVLESLTNVLRHAGPVPTWVRVDYLPARLTVRVDNEAAQSSGTQSPPGGGRGLAGMRARVDAQGGTLSAGPTDTFAWSVVAVLPLPEEHP